MIPNEVFLMLTSKSQGTSVGSFQEDQRPTKLSSFNAFRDHVTESNANETLVLI